MSKRIRRTFDESFKQQAVQLSLTSGEPISKTAEDLGIKESTLRTWLDKAKNPSVYPPQSLELDVSKVHEELVRLRKENQRLKDTCDILKKASAYFLSD